jgi:uncharacterized protein (TIGR03067 family)
LTFKDETVTTDGDWLDLSDLLRGRYRLNPKRRPKVIDFAVLGTSFQRQEWEVRGTPGLYELDGDKLRLSIPENNSKSRPAGLEPAAGTWVYTFRRKEH